MGKMSTRWMAVAAASLAIMLGLLFATMGWSPSTAAPSPALAPQDPMPLSTGVSEDRSGATIAPGEPAVDDIERQAVGAGKLPPALLVRDSASGRPVPNLSVRLCEGTGELGSAGSITARAQKAAHVGVTLRADHVGIVSLPASVRDRYEISLDDRFHYVVDGGALDTATAGALHIVDVVPGYAVHGTIRSASGAPVPGAVVFAFVGAILDLAGSRPPARPSGFSSAGDRLAVSDAGGEYELSGIPTDLDLELVVLHPDFAPQKAGVARAPAFETRLAPDILLRDGLPVTIQVLAAETRQPVADAGIRFLRHRGSIPPVGQVSTGPTGSVELPGFREGHYKILVHARGHAAVRSEFSVPAKGPVIVELPPGARIAGRALDAVTGAPVAGARVVVRSGSLSLPPDSENPILTDAGGSFSVDILPAGPAQLTVAADGYEPVDRLSVIAPEDHVTVRLRPAHEIHGIVVTADGHPVSSFKLHWMAKSRPFVWYRRSIEAAHGRFVLEDLAADRWRIGATTSEAFALSAAIPLEMGSTSPHTEDQPIELVLEQLPRIAGVVVASGTTEPVAGARVTVVGAATSRILDSIRMLDARFIGFFAPPTLASGESDLQGRFSLAVAPLGPTILRVDAEGFVPFHTPVGLDRDHAAAGVVVELERLRRIRGIVRDAAGNPATAANAFLLGDGPLPDAVCEVGADGRFELPVSSEPVRVRVSSAAKRGATRMWKIEGTFAAGEKPVELRVPDTSGAILGTILTAGQPALGAVVSLTQSDGAGGWNPTAPQRRITLRANGSFDERGLEPGSYMIRYRLGARSERTTVKVVAGSPTRADITIR